MEKEEPRWLLASAATVREEPRRSAGGVRLLASRVCDCSFRSNGSKQRKWD
ncbi:hypothetical protein KFK09_000474 [Dendrobium nobile]|uniref:Uncharacterized protein n=1 Tax=Dendrobium nobile TaxID=94219 RepID=A0A8T3CB69_DENNO|nr:hypothetical protein KFK09_000474 [Dendrobium nobile]